MSEYQYRPRIVGKQVEEAANLVDLDVSHDLLIRFLRAFDLIQQRDVAIGYDDAPILPWSVKVKRDDEARRASLFKRAES